ncbi:DUF4126 domain-containing protein [Isoptericola variabilis]|uniref:DUF4126 domain-containing protein n=1 Tax=Isoptericola variabilis (strain 225) TaxID=743718 RepID=F6FRG2_ISOV2|nr:DUF4126 domain-containing protein [Isoptericola variabilis]AEG43923.1 hypothetical protein Isova_1151 [Isoptericola variabilis 225]TWH30513.1 uncharacterized protein DUF4126 [Isoptericola variabilis J7]
MLELATGSGLALAAGLNAWIPLLGLGLLSRYTDLVTLPPAWAWLENGWVLVILAVLLSLEMVADKIPVVDSINDVVQTVVRPTAGGIAFGAGATSETTTVTDPATFVESGQWVPVVLGIVLALVAHATKAGARVVANTTTAGTAAPVVSAAEDVGSVGLSVAAVLLPVLVVPVLIALVVAAVLVWRGVRRRRQGRGAAWAEST